MSWWDYLLAGLGLALLVGGMKLYRPKNLAYLALAAFLLSLTVLVAKTAQLLGKFI